MAGKYLIMRGVKNTSRQWQPLPQEAVGRKIEKVWLLLDEAGFEKLGRPAHHVNAFLDDHYHDWNVSKDGTSLTYHAHSSAVDDVVDVILEFAEC
ncbi:hypothetical protein WK13_34650 [Burkholderia ubonensis]|nr:hypothetical protein WK13_34650 [Burkholderia ubonensis]